MRCRTGQKSLLPQVAGISALLPHDRRTRLSLSVQLLWTQRLSPLNGGDRLRLRSPENLIAELKWALRNFHPEGVIFEDDLFVSDPRWIERFTHSTAGKSDCHTNVRFTPIKSRINDSISQKFRLPPGRGRVQTLNERVRQELLKRPETNSDVERTLELLSRYKILFNVFHITGLPEVNESDELRALELYRRTKPGLIHFVNLTYYPEPG